MFLSVLPRMTCKLPERTSIYVNYLLIVYFKGVAIFSIFMDVSRGKVRITSGTFFSWASKIVRCKRMVEILLIIEIRSALDCD